MRPPKAQPAGLRARVNLGTLPVDEAPRLEWTFIVNPAAATCPTDVTGRIARRFPKARIRFTRASGDAGRLARRALGDAPGGIVVACGGDGTFREVATEVGTEATLGFVPVGTVNLLARELAIPLDMDAALRVLEQGHPKEIFAGRCAAEGTRKESLFFIGVTAGPDADAVHAVGPLGKRRLGRYIYAVHFFLRLTRPIRNDTLCEVAGATIRCSQFFALRMPRYAGDYRISTACSLFRPEFEVVTVCGGRLALIQFYWRLFRSRVAPLSQVSRRLCREARVRLPPHGRFQVDGDAFRGKELRLSAEPRPLRVIAGAAAPT